MWCQFLQLNSIQIANLKLNTKECNTQINTSKQHFSNEMDVSGKEGTIIGELTMENFSVKEKFDEQHFDNLYTKLMEGNFE